MMQTFEFEELVEDRRAGLVTWTKVCGIKQHNGGLCFFYAEGRREGGNGDVHQGEREPRRESQTVVR